MTTHLANAERALIAAAWVNPGPFASDADRLALHLDDFDDRLCGVVAGYLRLCGESGRVPTLAGAEAVLDSFAVPRAPDELFHLLIDTLVPRGADLTDLIVSVQRQADDRREDECRALARDALRAWAHAFGCRRCHACQRSSAWKGRIHHAA